jgi:hypothetical protein
MDGQRFTHLFRTLVMQHPAALCALLVVGIVLTLCERGLLDPVVVWGAAPLSLLAVVCDGAAQQRCQQRAILQRFDRLQQALAQLDAAPVSGQRREARSRSAVFRSEEWRVIARHQEASD